MTSEEIKKKVLAYGDWEFWADRPFRGAFVLSLFRGYDRKYFKKIGLNIEPPAALFQDGAWYKSRKVWDETARQLASNMPEVDIFKIVSNCEGFYGRGFALINKLLVSKKPARDKLREISDLLYEDIAYTWVAHGYEHYYSKKLYEEVPKYYSGDIEKFIGDISYPSKKNAHVYFVEALSGDESLESVKARFGWIKVRDGFSEPYSIEELLEERARIRKNGHGEIFQRPEIPDGLKDLARETQELVYFRTFRTDVLWEFMYMIRPILKEVAIEQGITFENLRYCDIEDVINGKIKIYRDDTSLIAIGGEIALWDEPVLEEKKFGEAKELKGAIAFKGSVKGTAKIVMTAYDIDKVKEGDILIAPTTAPSYIIGMNKAAAFVTDEGGITSHAAIVSREMKKPCIIGTKNATRVLKDGDFIEVNANEGIVKVIKKAK